MTTKQGAPQGADADDGQCLLNYRPSTFPAPIQVGSAAQAVLHTAALPPAGENVYCDTIIIVVPVGTEAGAIFQEAPSVSVNTGKWSLTTRRGRDSGLADDDGTDHSLFIFECLDKDDYLINYNLVFSLTGAVAPLPAQCEVKITEHSGTSDDPSTFTVKKCTYTLMTSTPIFYLTNFVATATAAPTVPATEFANGADINFSWESSGTFFQVFEKNNPQPIYADTQTSFTLQGGVNTDSTFVLVAMVSGNPADDEPLSGYQPIYLYDALTVTISNPDLTPNSVEIAGDAIIGGTLGVTGISTLADTSINGNLGIGTQQNPGNSGALNVDQTDLNAGSLSPGLTFGSGSGEGISSNRTANDNGNSFGLDFYTSFTRRLSITQGGQVGVGTSNPTQALLVVGGTGGEQSTGTYGFLNSSYPTGIYSAPQQMSYSIWATGRIASPEFNAFSDERIKHIQGRSDGAADLRTLLSLEIMDYRHKDVHAKGVAPHKKLIAQQVEQVFPQAVGRQTEVVPDIYCPAQCADGWVELATDLKAGERVRLISEKGEGVYEVLEVRPDRFRTSFEPAGDRIFVYGREVDDFRTLDYDAVVALNVSATQQLKREKDREVEALRSENEALLNQLNRLESKLEAALSLLATTDGVVL